MSDETIENLSFEEALTKLEVLVRELEAGKVKLDDAVSAYEQAIKLKKFCENKLNDAKLKIEKIETTSNGNLSLTPLDKIENNE
ncbi:MAG: exodeoxyribonuclease VII small subunit [Alphaproteobacteria bacterium]|nr:exodeoxyribonuclease VII small subunit [Alphaproteobacteria bacterium]